MATTLTGWRNLRLSRDQEGHRTYKIDFAISSDDPDDGPETILGTAGLPSIGATWSPGNDSDVWAFATPMVEIRSSLPNEPSCEWVLTQTFTTVPMRRCQTLAIEDPLLEPDRVDGSFLNYVVEATHDRFGNRLITSSHEQFRGPQVEFDAHRAQVVITRNIASIGLPLLTQMMNTVNGFALWGLPPRHIKLSSASWTQLYQGVCGVYYQRTLHFDVDFNGFDRLLADEGTKVLSGRWGLCSKGEDPDTWILVSVNTDECATGTGTDLPDPSPDNPAHFIHYKDRQGENTNVLLDGEGKPVQIDPTGTGGTDPGERNVEYYPESDFTLLGIPITL